MSNVRRFVILEHDHPTVHWDLMLEYGSVLRTWRLAKPPAGDREAIQATRIGDHRTIYLDYEGPVSSGRGTVRRWDSGEYEALSGIDGDEIRVRFRGIRLRGVAVLRGSGEEYFFWMESDV